MNIASDVRITFSPVATNLGKILNCWTFDILNIYTCPFLLRRYYFFSLLTFFLFFGIYAVLLLFSDSQLYATLTERCIIVY